MSSTSNSNTVMHPRNIYNKRLNFNALASKFPEFKKHTTLVGIYFTIIGNRLCLLLYIVFINRI